MEAIATKKTQKREHKPVQLAIAQLPGRRYEEDKPKDCRFCYYWAGRVRGCSRKECWYLIPLPEKPKREFDENGVPVLNCRTCAYGKQGPCIGYCIAKIEREVFAKTRGKERARTAEQSSHAPRTRWKLPAEHASDPGSKDTSACGVMA